MTKHKQKDEKTERTLKNIVYEPAYFRMLLYLYKLPIQSRFTRKDIKKTELIKMTTWDNRLRPLLLEVGVLEKHRHEFLLSKDVYSFFFERFLKYYPTVLKSHILKIKKYRKNRKKEAIKIMNSDLRKISNELNLNGKNMLRYSDFLDGKYESKFDSDNDYSKTLVYSNVNDNFREQLDKWVKRKAFFERKGTSLKDVFDLILSYFSIKSESNKTY